MAGPSDTELKNVPASFNINEELFNIDNWNPPHYQSEAKDAYDRMRHSYWTTACIQKYKNAMALVRPVAQKWDQKSENWVRVPNHPIEQLIDEANQYETVAEFFGLIAESLWLTGNALISIKDTRTMPEAPTIALELLRTDLVKLSLEKDKNGALVDGYSIQKEGWATSQTKGKFVSRKNMIHIRMSNFERLDWGISPLESVRNVQETEADAVAYNRSFMRNSGRPPYVLCSDEPLSALSRWQIQQALTEDTARGRSGLPLILTHGIKPHSLGHTPVEMDYIKADRLNGERIASIFQIPSPLININENATLANVREFIKLFWTQGVVPLLEIIFQALSKYWVTPRWGANYKIYYDTSSIPELMDHTMKKAEIMTLLIDRGYTMNELNVKLELGLPYNPVGNIRIIDGVVIDWADVEPPENNNSSGDQNSADDSEDADTPEAAAKRFKKSRNDKSGLSDADVKAMWEGMEFSRKTIADTYASKMYDLMLDNFDSFSYLPCDAMTRSDMLVLNEQFESSWKSVFNRIWYEVPKYFIDDFQVRYKKKSQIPLSLTLQEKNELSSIGGNRAKEIMEDNAQFFEDYVFDLRNKGYTKEEITEQVKSNLEFLVQARTQMVLEAEIIAASNMGNFMAAKKLQLTQKTWRSRPSKGKRGSYANMDGEVRLLNERYSNRTLFPGDPDRPMKDLIKSRCFETYE